jgi:hypothetical protein
MMALVVILSVGALVRGAYLHDLERDPMFLHPVLDAELHDYWARALVSGDWRPPPNRHDPQIPSTPFFRPPGYPYVLSVIHRITGGTQIGARRAQFVLGLGTCLLAFFLGRRLRDLLAGTIAAALAATFWPMIYFEGELLDSSLLATVLLGASLLTLRAADRPTIVRAAASGAMLGFAVLVRPNVLPAVAVAALWVFWVVRRRGIEGAGRSSAVLLLASALVVLPCALRNHRVSGDFVLVSANGGINFWIGNNPEADGVHAAVPEIQALTGQRGWTCFDYPRLVGRLVPAGRKAARLCRGILLLGRFRLVVDTLE